MRNYKDRPVEIDGTSVEVTGSFEKALRQFNKKVQDAGIIKECRDRQFYEPLSVKKKKDQKAARKRWLKQQAKSAPKKG